MKTIIDNKTFISYNKFCERLNEIKSSNTFSFVLTDESKKYLLSKLKGNRKENDEIIYFGMLNIKKKDDEIELVKIEKNKEILLNIIESDGILKNFIDINSILLKKEENEKMKMDLLIEKYLAKETVEKFI